MQRPSLGRIVHCLTRQPDGSQKESAAMITYVYDDDTIDMTVFARGIAAAPLTAIKMDGKNDPAESAYSWVWPSRV